MERRRTESENADKKVHKEGFRGLREELKEENGEATKNRDRIYGQKKKNTRKGLAAHLKNGKKKTMKRRKNREWE